MTDRKRVLICYVIRGHLGLQNKLQTLARGFDEAGFEVDLRVLDAALPKWSRLWQWLKMQLAFLMTIALHRNRLIFVRYNYQFLPVFLMAKLFAVRTLHLELNSDHCSEFALHKQELRGRIDTWAFRLALSAAAHVHVVSRELIQRVKASIASDKYVYNPNYVVDEYYDPSVERDSSAPVNLVFLGDVSQPWQGVLRFVSTVVVGNEWFKKNARLHIVGKSSPELDRLIAAEGLTDVVQMHGYLSGSEKASFMSGMQIGIGVFDLAAKNMTETTSIKVGEYLYAGLAVIIGYIDLSLPSESPFVLRLDLSADVQSAATVNRFVTAVGSSGQTRLLAHQYAADNLAVSGYVGRVIGAGARECA